MATEDDDRTVAGRVKATVLEMPASPAPKPADDDEATSVDARRQDARPSAPTDIHRPTQLDLPAAGAPDELARPTQLEVPKPSLPRPTMVDSPAARAQQEKDDDSTQARPPPAMRPKEPAGDDSTQARPPPAPKPLGPSDSHDGESRLQPSVHRPRRPGEQSESLKRPATEQYTAFKPLKHPLVPIGIAFVILFILLAVLSWWLKPAKGEAPPPDYHGLNPQQ
jgi:hypothetical protein